MRSAFDAPHCGTDAPSCVPRALQGQPAYAAETLYAGNKSYAEELEALIAARNTKLPELKDAPPVVRLPPPVYDMCSLSELTRRSDNRFIRMQSASTREAPPVPLKLSDAVPKTLLETPSSVPEPQGTEILAARSVP